MVELKLESHFLCWTVNVQSVSRSKFIPVLRGVSIVAGMDKLDVAVNREAYEKIRC